MNYLLQPEMRLAALDQCGVSARLRSQIPSKLNYGTDYEVYIFIATCFLGFVFWVRFWCENVCGFYAVSHMWHVLKGYMRLF